MNKERNQTHPEVGEDTTQYGEFISSYFAWISLPDQKEKAKELVDMTKTEKKFCSKTRAKNGHLEITEEEK